MTRIINLPKIYNDMPFDIATNKIHSKHLITKFGKNLTAGTSWEPIWSASTAYAYQTTAQTMEAISTDANDTAAGTGARTISIEGLDSNCDYITETITMAGLSASTATTKSFFRVFRATVETVGVYGGDNLGVIVVRVSSAGATQAQMEIGDGASQMAMLSTPRGVTALLESFFISVASTKSVAIRVMQRKQIDVVSAPMKPFKAAFTLVSVIDSEQFVNKYGIPFEEKSDIVFEAKATSGSIDVSCSFQVVMEGWPHS